MTLLQELHSNYLPLQRHVIPGEEVVTILERLFFGGDQLKDERASNCKDAHSDGTQNSKSSRDSLVKWKIGMLFSLICFPRNGLACYIN